MALIIFLLPPLFPHSLEVKDPFSEMFIFLHLEKYIIYICICFSSISFIIWLVVQVPLIDCWSHIKVCVLSSSAVYNGPLLG